jgi:hypothetical protein
MTTEKFEAIGMIRIVEEKNGGRWRIQLTPAQPIEGNDSWFTAWKHVGSMINEEHKRQGGLSYRDKPSPMPDPLVETGPWNIVYKLAPKDGGGNWFNIEEARLLPQEQAEAAAAPAPAPAPQPASPIDDLFPDEVQPPMSKDVLIVRQVCLKEACNLVAADKIKLEQLYHVINVMEAMVFRTYTPSREDTVEEEIA